MLKNPSEIFNNSNEEISDVEISNLFDKFKVSTEIVESYDEFRRNIEKVNNLFEQVQNLSEELSEKLNKKDLESAIFSQLVLLDENYKVVQRYKKQLTKNEIVFCEKIDKIKKDVGNNSSFIENISGELRQLSNLIVEDYRTEFNEIKSSVAINEHHIKTIDNYLKEHHRELVEVKESVFDAISLIGLQDSKISARNFLDNFKRLEDKIDYIRETYSKIKSEDLVKEVISESIISDPPSTNNTDKLTPLDQNYVTVNQLEQHYRLFVNRIQQQLSTLGGGGETRLKYLDDIVGIATNPSIYDGKYLKYNHSIGKFEFDIADETNDSWVESSNGNGPFTLGTVGIGTSIVSNSSTKLQIHGDVKIVGILTIGSSSVTIDGDNNLIKIGNEVQLNSSGLAGTASNATNLNNQSASYYLDYNNFSNNPTGLSSFSNDVGFVTSSVVVGYTTEGFVNNLVSISTFSGNYNDLSNTPTALSSFSNDVGFITAGASGAGLTALTGASSGTYGNSTNSAQITVDSNGRITSISQVAISGGGGGGISGIKILNGETSLGVTTNLSFGNNLNAVSIGNTVSVSLTGVVTSLVGYATEGFVSNLVSISTFSGNYNDLSNTPTAYGDSDVDSHLNRTQQVSQNYVLSWDGQDYAWVAQSSGGISNVVEDTTPQLGGNLDLNSKDITGTGNLNVSGVVTATSFSGAIELSSDTSPQLGGNLFTNGNDIFVDDNDLLRLGSGYDFVMTHDGTNTTLKNHTGDLIIGNYGGEYPADDVIIESADDFEVRLNTGMNPGSGTTAIYATGGGSVALNHNGSTKFETTVSGVDITGHTETDTLNVSGVVTATSFSGIGSNLTGLTGASSGTYGSSTITPVVTIDANGRITSITTATISAGSGGGVSQEEAIAFSIALG